MGGCCSSANKPPNAGDEIGRLNFTGAGCCGGSAPYTLREGGCCQPSPPVGPEWEAAQAGPEGILAEVNTHVEAAASGCCGYHGKLEDVKQVLTEKGWMAKLNAHLQPKGLVADLDVFWVYNGQSSTQHMQMRVFKVESEGGKQAAEAASPNPQKMDGP